MVAALDNAAANVVDYYFVMNIGVVLIATEEGLGVDSSENVVAAAVEVGGEATMEQ